METQKSLKNELNLETDEEHKTRWRSILVIYATIFLMTVGYSITIPGVWPYLNKLDSDAPKEFIGFINAGNPLGQMIASPLFGHWVNRSRSTRVPLITTMILFAVGSLMYATISIFPSEHKYWLIVSRLTVGVSSGNLETF